MRAFASFDSASFANTFLVLAVAFVLGTAIGFERQYRQRTAGLRTNVLVAVGAAAFADIGMHIMGAEGAVRIIAYVVSGIGFLGAGVIMKDGTHVRGLNTAATLWCSAAVGAASGAGYVAEAILLTLFTLAGNTLLRPLVNHINRKPMDERVTEACYRVHLVCDPAAAADAREWLYEELEKADYPLREIEVLSDGEDEVELAAVLVPTTAVPEELDAVVLALEAHKAVVGCSWSVSTTN